MPDGNYSFAGIAHAEAQDRVNEHRSGVPGAGAGEDLQVAPAKLTAAVHVHNAGEASADLRLKHRGADKAVAAEALTALAVGGNRYVGSLQFKKIVPSSVVISNAGAPADIVDDGNGVLHDVGVPANVRGTINYALGVVDFTFGAAPTEPVNIAYSHQDSVDFASSQTVSRTAAGAYPEEFATSFGRVVPGSVVLTDGALTFEDDGKGNMLETTGGGSVERGSIDYGLGVITLDSGSAPLAGGAGAVTITFDFNPFASVVAAGGGQKLFDLFSQIPEIGGEAWADGIKGESNIALWGESRTQTQTNVIGQWVHYGEEPYQVQPEFSGVVPGGESNDPRLQ